MMRREAGTKARPKAGAKESGAKAKRAQRAPRVWTIYAIVDPRDDGIFYVGETRNLALRRAQHLAGTDQLSGLVIRQLAENGFVPHFVVLEYQKSEEAALRAEIFWIEILLSRGTRLTNAQAFGGVDERQLARRSETEKLDAMKRLRDLANGRRLTKRRGGEKTTDRTTATVPPKPTAAPRRGWSRRKRTATPAAAPRTRHTRPSDAAGRP